MSETKTRLYLDDLKAGQTFRSRMVTTVEDAAIKTFATEFDPQPFHLDDAAAQATMFKGLAASGWHTAAMTMQLLVNDGPPLAGGIIGGGMDELRWPQAGAAGRHTAHRMRSAGSAPVASRPEQGMVKMKTTTLNQNDEPVQVMVGNLIVPRKRRRATPHSSSPTAGRGDVGAFADGAQLEPHRRLDHPFAVGEGAKAAIGRGDHALALAHRRAPLPRCGAPPLPDARRNCEWSRSRRGSAACPSAADAS